jgi:hypothetical protein
MADQTHPNDPYRAPNRSYRYRLTDDDVRRQAGLDDELQPDPDLAEGPAGGGRIAIFAVGIAVILGAVFYGLNNSPIHQAGTSTIAQNTLQAAPPATPPGMRDVTPRANTEPGMTAGSVSANPKAPPAPAPSGSTE